MARIRSIYPVACTSHKLAAISAEAERLFWRLLTHCDDHGRCEDDPRVIWMHCGTHVRGWSEEGVDELLDELAEIGLIYRYDAAGTPAIEVAAWGKYQHPRRPVESELDPYSPNVSAGTSPDVRHEHAQTSPGDGPSTCLLPLGEGVGEGDGGEVAPTERRRTPDAVFEAVAEVCGIDWRNDLTRVARGQLNAAVGALKQVNATPDEIRRRAVNYRIEYPRNTLTPSALAKHWPQLARTTTKVSASTAAILGTP